jgi:hypothetical protein
MTTNHYRRTLSGADVDALFAGKFEKVEREVCDNCRLPVENDDALTFGGDDPLQMPVDPGGQLATELVILRRRHGRDRIVLCYGCTDVLQEPVGGRRNVTVLVTDRAIKVIDEAMPRLFAVE